MEEIDGIIIQSLKNLHCNIPEHINSLKQFDPDLVVDAIASCLEAIVPDSKFSHKLPPSMTLRLKAATLLAEQIKDLGFRGDMGYQSILYSNELEIRRVLMFLIERLPREASKSTVNEELGYVPRLVKEIEKRIEVALEKPWVPTCLLEYGARDCGNLYLQQSFGNSCPLKSERIYVPQVDAETSEGLRQFYSQKLPSVPQQCSSQNIISSLLFKDFTFPESIAPNPSWHLSKNKPEWESTSTITTSNISMKNEPKVLQESNLQAETLSKKDILIQEVQRKQEETDTIINEIKTMKNKLEQVKAETAKEEQLLKDTETKVQIKMKTLTVLSKEENMDKLKGLINKGTERLVHLAEQWDEVQKPLLEEYRALQSRQNSQKDKALEEMEKLKGIQQLGQQLTVELKEKEQLEQQLIEKCKNVNKNSSRLSYTKRILEIIANVKKQNHEIQKVLKDTKEVQKEINILNGQVDRSFTLADELIFRDARHEDMARKAYKMLAALHSECGEIIKAFEEMGQIERESRNLQDQVDAEITKETATKLDRVLADIEQVKKEIAALIQK